MATNAPRRNPTGRPPLDRTDPSIHVGLRLPTKKYDQLYRRASIARMSISDYVRAQLWPVTARARERDGR